MSPKHEHYQSQTGMASAQGDDDTARKLRHLQDFTNSHSENKQHQQQPQPSQPQQQTSQQPPLMSQVQRTHAGFALGPPGEPRNHHGPPPPSTHGSSHAPPPPPPPPPSHHHNQLPPMVDPQLGGGQHLAPIQTPPGQQAPISSMLQSPDSPMSHADSERKGRQLSTTKRAAQNRAAQRAFRQRKEVHIKNLETKVQEIEPLKTQVVELQRDNYTLRGYLITMLEMIAKKGLEPPPGVPKMHMDPAAYNPPSMAVDQPSEDQPNGGEPPSSSESTSRPQEFSSQHGPAGAPTAPMQDIAQQASQAVDRAGDDGVPESTAS